MLEKTDSAVAQLVERLQNAGFDQAPQLVDAAIRGAQVDALVTIWGAVFVGVLFIGALVMCVFFLARGEDGAALGCFWGVVLFAGILICMLVASDVWLKLTDPEAAVYRDILAKLLKSGK